MGGRSTVRKRIEELIEQHRDVRSAVARLTALFDLPYQDAEPHLYAARADIGRRVMRCLKFQDEVVLAPLHERGLLSRIPCSASIESRTRELRLLYSAHIVDWTAGAIAKDWPGYIASAKRLNVLLHELTALKETQLYPEAIRLLDRA
ncbi:hypothetical protein [Sphingomonas sanguinis]|uniref:hypothetical protein n=1 Tax=Sphingomonas sanguinis TaxID=33051 RepID=UPI00301960EA